MTQQQNIEMKNLEGRLEGVNIGDLLVMQTDKGWYIAGFVKELFENRIKVSHDDLKGFHALLRGDKVFYFTDTSAYGGYKVVKYATVRLTT